MEIAEDEIDVERSLVRFIDDDRVVLSQIGILPRLGEEDAVGHEFHTRRRLVGAVLEADLVADLASERHLQFLRDARRHRGRGDAARLGAADAAAFRTETELERDLRKLGRLPRARVAADDDHGVPLHRRADIIASFRNGEFFWKGEVQRKNDFPPRGMVW